MTYIKKPLGVTERLVVTGTLIFTSPVLFQAGNEEGLTDFVILRDEVSRQPLLPGASLAGALRSYLHASLPKTDPNGLDQNAVATLFGSIKGGDSERSWLIVEEALGTEAGIEIRDGVKIAPSTQTAEDEGKYDMEMLASGTSFEIGFELLIPDDLNSALRTLFYTALSALENGEIRLGAKKHRGFGQCHVQNWQVHRYLMSKKQDVIRWLKNDRATPESEATLYENLGFKEKPKLPASDKCIIALQLGVKNTMMVRSYSSDPKQPDMVHLRNHAGDLVLPGTSLAGVLRAQARRIAALRIGQDHGDLLVNGIFGSQEPDEKGRLKGSRLVVSESSIQNPGADITQNRIKMDVFTGGTFSGALFNEKPVIGGSTEIQLEISQPSKAELALLLLLARDLWEGMLFIGGESSIGRGYLQGINGSMKWEDREYQFSDNAGNFSLDAEENFIADLLAALVPA